MVAADGPELERTDPHEHAPRSSCGSCAPPVAVGRIDDAATWAAAATALADRLRLPVGSARAACARAEVLLARGETAEAARLAQQAERGRRSRRAPAPTRSKRCCWPAARFAAEDHRCSGSWPRPAAHGAPPSA